MPIKCLMVSENHKMVREMSGKSQGILWGLMAGHPERICEGEVWSNLNIELYPNTCHCCVIHMLFQHVLVYRGTKLCYNGPCYYVWLYIYMPDIEY